ncbi:hypothetical protein [Trichothermofontia sp.]
MATLFEQHYRQTTVDEQKLYDHLLYWSQLESPARLIERFRTLFLGSGNYPDMEVAAALERIVSSREVNQRFHFIINRCCHILINRWQMQPQHFAAIPELISLFEQPPGNPRAGLYRSRSARRLQELIQHFLQTEQYTTLKRLARVMSQAIEARNGSRSLGTLIQRYPYLYRHCLLSEDSSYEQQQVIDQLEQQRQRQFEVDLSRYVTYQIRRAYPASRDKANATNLIRPVSNPTLLNDRELYLALKQFVGRVDSGYSYQEMARHFTAHSSQIQTYRAFKEDFYRYITSSIAAEYGKRQFYNQLYGYLQNTLPQSDSQRPSDFLVVRTCSQLLNFLVVESANQPQHYVFVDLLSNLGPAATTGLLLKIILVCRKVKPYLEKRFSILFNHYENFDDDAVQWLVKALENMNLALTTNFGAIDLSLIKRIV